MRRHAEGLERLSDRLIACRVVLEIVKHRHRPYNRHRVPIELALAGDLVVADRELGQHRAHEGICFAVRDAFEAALRLLLNHMCRLDGQLTQRESH